MMFFYLFLFLTSTHQNHPKTSKDHQFNIFSSAKQFKKKTLL
jgi:hypothetical protein